jgi:hypothetical protein
MKARWLLPWFLCATFAVPCLAGGRVTLYVFSSKSCINCLREKEFLAGLQQRIPELEVRDFEVVSDPANAKLLVQVAEAFGVQARGVPVTFIGPFAPIMAYESDQTTGRLIEERVRECLARGCEDPVGPLVGNPPPPAAAEAPPRREPAPPAGERVGAPAGAGESGTVLALPLLGRTDLTTLPLFALTVILGALDSFNPCAFFVLFSLLGILMHAHSRKRMLFIGGVFVLFSGVVYFVFMAAWLNLFLYIGQLQLITTAAGVVALCVAGINIKDFFLFKRGISLTIPEGRKPGLFARMRGLVGESSVPAMFLGTVVLALAANTYELLCTAGFPLIFTRILTLSSLPPAEYYLYLVLYNTVYVLPLAAVVVAFSLTLGSHKLSEAQGRVMKLVSGLMMLGLGVVVLVDPGLFGNMLVGAGLLAFALLAAAAIVGLERSRKIPGGVR